METKISEIRKEYTKGKLTQCTINDNPFEQFEEWLNDAIAVSYTHLDVYKRQPLTSYS